MRYLTICFFIYCVSAHIESEKSPERVHFKNFGIANSKENNTRSVVESSFKQTHKLKPEITELGERIGVNWEKNNTWPVEEISFIQNLRLKLVRKKLEELERKLHSQNEKIWKDIRRKHRLTLTGLNSKEINIRPVMRSSFTEKDRVKSERNQLEELERKFQSQNEQRWKDIWRKDRITLTGLNSKEINTRPVMRSSFTRNDRVKSNRNQLGHLANKLRFQNDKRLKNIGRLNKQNNGYYSFLKNLYKEGTNIFKKITGGTSTSKSAPKKNVHWDVPNTLAKSKCFNVKTSLCATQNGAPECRRYCITTGYYADGKCTSKYNCCCQM